MKPVGFTYRPELGAIDIAGFNMGQSAKYRNVRTNPRVAFVVDEVTEPTMAGAHFLELRGVARTTVAAHDPERPSGAGDHPDPDTPDRLLQRRPRSSGLRGA